jgi:SAM-dependent methyltransferase
MKGESIMKRALKILVVLVVLAAPPALFEQEWHLDVPYVPTRPEVVDRMLEMASVGKSDVLYDLGCGDGRIVITAAERYGTRGVGVDINPERIRESRENAAKAGVTNLVEFREQDLFQTDFHRATVVTLYLLTSVNLRLRPILFAQLQPGTRVVSHDFSMDSWTPDNTDSVVAGGRTHNLFFWVIPANFSGTWEWKWTEGAARVPCKLDVDQHFQAATGRFTAGSSELPLKDLTITGDHVRIRVERGDEAKSEVVVFEGRVSGDSVEGTVGPEGASKSALKPWTAKRTPLSKKAIDAEARDRLGRTFPFRLSR